MAFAIPGIVASSIVPGCTYPVFRSVAENYATTGTSHACNKPSGTIEGDLMFAIVNSNGNVTITDPSGWTRIDEDNGISTGGTAIILYKVAGASEPTSYTWSLSASNRCGIAIATFSGSYAADPSNGTHSERIVGGSSSDDANASSMTLTNGCAMVIYASGFDEPANYVWSEPTGWTAATSNGGTNNVYIGYNTFENSGATGTVSYTFTASHSATKVMWLWSAVRND